MVEANFSVRSAHRVRNGGGVASPPTCVHKAHIRLIRETSDANEEQEETTQIATAHQPSEGNKVAANAPDLPEVAQIGTMVMELAMAGKRSKVKQ